MVRLSVLSSGGSVLDWLVVRLGGDRDGVRGQRGRRSPMLSRESSPLPLEAETGRERERESDHQLIDLNDRLTITFVALFWCHQKCLVSS